MTKSKRTTGLDDVLTEYAHASREFDARVLQDFVDRYPEHAEALRRYAYIQLSSVPATKEEVETEFLADEEMLLKQSMLLQRMQQLRSSLSTSQTSDAAKKLASISGEFAMQKAATAIFGSYGHGEDLLLISVTESTTEIRGIPDWFFEELGKHIDAAPAAVVIGMAKRRVQPAAIQRFSSKNKPKEAVVSRWEQLVEECISDDLVKNKILTRVLRS